MRSPAGFPSRARREDLLPLAGRQAGTVVLDRERDSPTSTLDGDRDGRPPVATRVLDDRMQHPLGQIGVDAEPQALARRLCDNVDVTFLGERLDSTIILPEPPGTVWLRRRLRSRASGRR